MPFLYTGIPDRPEWLRSRMLRRAMRSGLRRDKRKIKRGESLIDAKFGARIDRRARRRKRWARVVDIITDPSVTFILGLFGAPLIAVQLDRLTRDDGTGSVPLIIAGAVALALSVWFARTREAVLAREADINESEWLQARFSVIDEAIRDAAEVGERAREENQREILSALRDIEARISGA